MLERQRLENHGKRPTKRGSASSLFPSATSKVKKNHPSDCGPHAYERRDTSSYQLFKVYTTKWHKRKEGTPSFLRHTLFRLYQKFEGGWQATATQKGPTNPPKKCLWCTVARRSFLKPLRRFHVRFLLAQRVLTCVCVPLTSRSSRASGCTCQTC